MSKFSINDPVSFINEKQDGYIKAIKPNGIYLVEIEDGFDIEVQENELVLIRKLKTNLPTEIPVVKPTEKIIPDFIKHVPALANGVWLAICPSQDGMVLTGPSDYYIVNKTDFMILVSVSLKKGSSINGIQADKVMPSAQLYITTIKREEKTITEDWFIQLLFFREGEFEKQTTVTKQFPLVFPDLAAAQLLLNAPYSFCKFDKIADSYSLNILETDDLFRNFSAKDVGNALNSARVQPEVKSKHNAFTSQHEIDLHIEKLVEGFEKMSNAEIINIQLKHFRKKLDEALFKKFHKIVFIHGSGNGRLKNEIRKELDDHQIKYSDGNYAQYGGGATEVHLV